MQPLMARPECLAIIVRAPVVCRTDGALVVRGQTERSVHDRFTHLCDRGSSLLPAAAPDIAQPPA